jgi:nicotinamidase-related amidase
MKVLIIVDAQVDFVTGALANPVAEERIPAIKERVIAARENHEMVIFTQDTHMENYMDTLEGEKLPVEHCIYQTEGWEIVEELRDEAALRVLKPTFGSFDLIDRVVAFRNAFNEDIEIELCGFCTDICVCSNALFLRAAMPDARIVVNGGLCAGTTKENHDAALAVMRSCQIDVI